MSITRMRTSFSQYLKPLFLLIAVVFLIGAVYTVFNPFSGRGGDQEDQSQSGNIAEVNGVKISRAEFQTILNRQFDAAKSHGNVGPLEMAGMKSNILTQLINQTIRVTEAKKEGISVTRADIRKEREKMINEQIDQLRESAGQGRKKKLTDKELDLLLARSSRPTSIKQIRSEMQSTLTDDVLREQILMERLDDKIKSKADKIDDERLKEAFTQFNVRHIVLRVDGKPEAQVERQANEIHKKIAAGEDFGKLAKEYSDDTSTKDKGGVLGPMSSLADKALQGMKAGQVSGVISTPGAFRIVKVDSVNVQLPEDFDKEKEEFRKQLQSMVDQQITSEYYEKLQASADVKVIDPELNAYWTMNKAQTVQNEDERNKLLDKAASLLRTATTRNNDASDAYATLAQLYVMRDKVDDAIAVLVDILDTRHLVEDAGLRLSLAQLYIQKGEKDKAKPNVEIASDMAQTQDNPGLHYQIQNLCDSLGLKEQSARESEWIADYQKRQQEAQAPPPAPKPEEKPDSDSKK